MKTITVYEASDGSRFDDMNSCNEYEQSLSEESEKSIIEQLSEVKGLQFIDEAKDVPPIDQACKTDFASYYWFVPLTKTAASKAERILWNNYLQEVVEKGKVYCIEEWEGDESVYSLDDCRSFAKEFFDLFEAYNN